MDVVATRCHSSLSSRVSVEALPHRFTPMRPVLLVVLLACAFAAPLAPTRLRVQDMPAESTTLSVVDPDGALKFTWANAHTARAVTQTAARVVVATSADMNDGSIVWDSGKVAQQASVLSYSGPRLTAGSSLHWAVQWWDNNGTHLQSAILKFSI